MSSFLDTTTVSPAGGLPAAYSVTRRKCARCPQMFLAKTTAKYCLDCRDRVLSEKSREYEREAQRRRRERRKQEAKP